MSNFCVPFGHLEGVVSKVNDHGKGYITFEVTTESGTIGYGSDIHGDQRSFPIAVGMKICMEEADISFENGRIVYGVDEKLRCVVELDNIQL